MNSMILVGLLLSFIASTYAGILPGGYSGASIGGVYSTGVISTGPAIQSAPVATSSISQQRIVHSVPIVTRIVAQPSLTSASYVSGGQGSLGNIGYGSSNTVSLNGYGGYGRNGY